MAARYGYLINKWTVAAVAALALMAALLATVLPVWAQDSPPRSDDPVRFDYVENGTGEVHIYGATDPEGKKVFWTLDGVDAGVFSIDDGALRFKSSPDYENPTDGADPDTIPPAIADNNIYRVTVRFGAGGEDGEPGEPADTPPDIYAGDDLGELYVTVTVTNKEESGMVHISSLQPQVGTELTATVTDLDGVAVAGNWQWASSHSKSGPFTDIPDRSDDMTYRPIEADLGKYLQVTARYRDNVSGADAREESAVSAHPVRKDIVTSNDPPKYPDQTTLGIDTDVDTGATILPERTETERFIHENSPAGTRVGAPVTAFDDATDIEVLTYSLSGARGHVDSFNIDPVTGQITVAAGVRLNADVDPETVLGGAQGPYEVTVIATDGDGDIQTIDVEIRVVRVDEPPTIDREYRAEITHNVYDNYDPGDRAPTEISHYESDRTDRSATTLDADLDSSVLVYANDGTVTLTEANIQPATYTAMDPEDDNATLTWSLAGPDATRMNADGDSVSVFTLDTDATTDGLQNIGEMAMLAFAEGPDHETPWDTNKDNVYEVTLVVTDSVGATGEYDVTVKVINSTDDNKPGKVRILNRVPEVATMLTATFGDPDKPTREVKWQWYRSVTTTTDYRDACPDSEDGHRYFLDTLAADIATNWQEISGATSASYTPGYDEDSGGEKTESNTTDSEGNILTETVTWTGGDIDVTIVTTKATDTVPESTYYNWQPETSSCLRAAVTYRDDVDPTHAGQNDPDTDVDETLEGTFIVSEYPVKRIDEENDAPVFTEGGTTTGTAVSSYTAERREDTPATSTDTLPITIRITEAFAATDLMTDEDDDSTNPVYSAISEDADDRNSPGPGPGADILTYSLSGTDAKHFVIVGSVDHPMGYNLDESTAALELTDAADQGALIITDDLDFESKTRYTVTITATDPSGDADSVNVTVHLTNYNDMPTWVTKAPNSPAMVVYAENGTADVGIYLAKDPEGAGISYSLVTAVDTDADITADDIADRAKFSIDPLDGNLSFKSSPNYEKPGDTVTTPANNMYQVTVSATVVDDPPLTGSTDPMGPHVIVRKVTVVVTNLNEAPVFSETTDTLMISENPDDPEKEPPSAAGYLYLLNRGVGKPAANLPAAPDLDVGIPVAAVDDDSTGNFAVGGYGESPAVRDRIDGLTYTLSGTDAAHFHVVPATGQILTLEKLDYEAKKEYKVTVKATDPMGESDSINMTIEVTDVDEVPVTPNLVVSGPNPQTYEENGTGAVGEYMAVGTGADMVRWIPLEGADSDYFELEGSGSNVMLKFRNPPNYEIPRGMAMSEDNTNTYMVTVKIEHTPSGETAMQDVTITVTDAAELGTLAGDEMVTYEENGESAVGTYKVDGPMADMAMWTLEGDDMDQFTLDTDTGDSVMLMFVDSPNYEMPREMAMSTDNANTYMVTVKAMVSGEMEMQDVTISVTDADDPGMVAITPQPQTLRPGTMLTADLSDDDGNVIDATWRWSRSMTMDGIYTNIVGATSMTYTPVEADDGYYLMATATYTDAYGSGKTARSTTTSAVAAVPDQPGTVRLSSMTPVIGAMLTATLFDLDSGITGETWQWSRSMTMGGTFMDIAGATSMTYTPVEADDGYHLRATVMYTDAHGPSKEEMATTTGMVTTVADRPGTVALSMSHPVVDTAITATLTDPDGGVTGETWQWSRSMTMGGTFMDIAGATSMSYTPVAADENYYLMAKAMYTDAHGSGKMRMATSANAVSTGDPLVVEYDTNPRNDMIDRAEVISAINDYLDNGVPSRADVIRLINLYLDS